MLVFNLHMNVTDALKLLYDYKLPKIQLLHLFKFFSPFNSIICFFYLFIYLLFSTF